MDRSDSIDVEALPRVDDQAETVEGTIRESCDVLTRKI